MQGKHLSLLSLFFLSSLLAWGETGLPAATSSVPASPSETVAPLAALILPDDPVSLLGCGLGDALERFGAPSHVSALRGEEAWQDDVVFSYATGYSLYWAGDRLWQLRFDPGYAGSVYGVFVGDSVDKTVSLLGSPYFRSSEAIVFRLAYKGYPVRLRVAVAAEKVSAIYLYRADF